MKKLNTLSMINIDISQVHLKRSYKFMYQDVDEKITPRAARSRYRYLKVFFKK